MQTQYTLFILHIVLTTTCEYLLSVRKQKAIKTRTQIIKISIQNKEQFKEKKINKQKQQMLKFTQQN